MAVSPVNIMKKIITLTLSALAAITLFAGCELEAREFEQQRVPVSADDKVEIDGCIWGCEVDVDDVNKAVDEMFGGDINSIYG